MVKNPLVTHQMLMNESEVNGNDYLTPLSCDVNLVLRPCTRYSDHTLKNIVEGAGMNKERQEIRDLLLNNLKEEMTDYLMTSPSYIIDPSDNLELKKQYNPLIKGRADVQRAQQEEEDRFNEIQQQTEEDLLLGNDEEIVDPETDRDLFIFQMRNMGMDENAIQEIVNRIPSADAVN
jgi:hypothetical protein